MVACPTQQGPVVQQTALPSVVWQRPFVEPGPSRPVAGKMRLAKVVSWATSVPLES